MQKVKQLKKIYDNNTMIASQLVVSLHMEMTIIRKDDLPRGWHWHMGETCLRCEYQIIPRFYLRPRSAVIQMQ